MLWDLQFASEIYSLRQERNLLSAMHLSHETMPCARDEKFLIAEQSLLELQFYKDRDVTLRGVAGEVHDTADCVLCWYHCSSCDLVVNV